MYRVPQSILDRLRCSICDGYLSSKPSMVKPDDQRQVCGKCFKLLPTEEKEKCVRQIGLEALSEVMIFPCRYSEFGCGFTYGWCEEKDHEAQCTYRYESEHVYCNVTNKREVLCENDEVKAGINYELKEGLLNCLVYNIKIKGNKDNVLVLKSGTNELSNVELRLKGTLSLKQPLEPIHTSIEVKEVDYDDDHVYESLNNKSNCFNCKTPLSQDSKYTCLFGHVSCRNCKGNMCVVCAKIMEKESKGFCKNYNKGCRVAMSTEAINMHQDNCEFNDFKCPLEPCNYIDLLPNVEDHLRQDHVDKVYQRNDVTRTFFNKDDVFVVIWNGGVFKCVYFYYKAFVEFFVVYVGHSQEAVNYSYEVALAVNGTILKKRSRCAHWNNLMLEKGISFDKKDLMAGNEKRLKFDINLKIIHN